MFTIPSSFAQIQGATSIEDAVLEVASYVKMPNDPEAHGFCRRAINDAIRFYNQRRWKALLTPYTITFVANTADYELSATVKAPAEFSLLDSSSKAKSRLYFKEAKTFLDEFPDRSSSGCPSVYTVLQLLGDGSVSLNCPPDSSFVANYPTAKVWFYPRIQMPTPGMGLNVTSEIEGGILWKAKALVASMKDQSKLQAAIREAEFRWYELIADDFDTTADGLE